MIIDICILTYKRDEGLSVLLNSLALLTCLNCVDMRIIIVDNYGQSDARNVCKIYAKQNVFIGGICYVIEERRGISHARNRALKETREVAEYVGFFDDDEIVHSRWLIEMKHAIERYGGDVWNGPVYSRYADDVPIWIIRGRFMDRKMLMDGSIRNTANTGNVLFRRNLLDEMPEWFDPARALSGGEDTEFFERAAAAGYKIVWASKAQVYETVTSSRANSSWLLMRRARIANQAALRTLGNRGIFWGLVNITRMVLVCMLKFVITCWGIFCFPWRKERVLLPFLHIASITGIMRAVTKRKQILEYK